MTALMTDAPRTAAAVADEAADLSSVIQRRLVGLIVLLAGLFLMSLLLRHGGPSSEALPTVVIPLGGTNPGMARSTIVDALPDAPPTSSTQPAASAAPEPESLAATLPATEEVAEVVEREKPAPKPVAETPRAESVAAPKPPPVAKPTAPKPATAKPDTASSRWFVAVGAYKDPMAAKAIANRVKLAGFRSDVSPVTVNKDKLQRVRAGPFTSKAAAEAARATLIVEGLTKAVTVPEK